MFWLPMLSFESMLFVAALVKVVQVLRYGSHTPRILAVLLRDSVVYFGGISVIGVTNLIIWSAARVSKFFLHPDHRVSRHSLRLL